MHIIYYYNIDQKKKNSHISLVGEKIIKGRRGGRLEEEDKRQRRVEKTIR